MGSANDEVTWSATTVVALDALRTPVWFYDMDRRTRLWANRSAVELWGAPNLAALIDDAEPVDLTEGTRRRLANYRQMFAKGMTVTEEWTLYRRDGSPVRVQSLCSGAFFEDEHGRRRVMFVEGHPLEEERPEVRLLEALRHIEEQITLYDAAGAPLVRNPAAEASLGLLQPLRPNDDRFSASFIDPDDARRARNAAAVNAVFREEVLVPTTDGPRWHDVEVRRVVDPLTGDDALLCCQRDVHVRHEMTRRLDAVRERAEAANRAKTQFLAVVSHELRTPITGVMAAARLLEESELDVDQKEALDMVQKAGGQMVSLIDELLDLPRIESGHLDVRLQPTDVERALLDGLGPLRARARADNRDVTLEVEPGMPAMSIDANRVLQIVVNLVSNAIKFSVDGEVRVVARAVGKVGPNALEIRVEDEGIGMAPEQISNVFEAFAQVDSSRSRARDGLGLGLFIARSLVTAMQGSITAVSELGVGSTFTVRIPAPVLCETESPPSERSSATADRRLALRVLVVDDNALNRRAVARSLKAWGCVVEIATGGRHAIASIEQRAPDVVLMDVQMPDFDGAQATILLRDNPALRDLPIIAVTADAFFRDTPAYRSAGFDGFVLKPIDWEELFHLLCEVADGRGRDA